MTEIEVRLLVRPSYKYQVVELEIKAKVDKENMLSFIDENRDILVNKADEVIKQLEDKINKLPDTEDVEVETLEEFDDSGWNDALPEPTDAEYDKYIDESEAL